MSQSIKNLKMIFLFFLFPNFTRSLEPLKRKSRSLEVGSVLIENETEELLKVYAESILVVSAVHATEISSGNRTSSHGIELSQGGFSTIRPRGKKVVKFTIPSMNGNSLLKCSIFTRGMFKVIDNEVLENGNGYRLEKLGDGFILEPLGKIIIYEQFH